jgi:hypothetical protein
MRQFRHSKRLDGVTAPSESGQIGHQCVELIGECFGGRQQIATGQSKPMEVHHHGRIRRTWRFTIENVNALDRGPPLGQPRCWSREAPLGAAVGPGRRSALDHGSATFRGGHEDPASAFCLSWSNSA